MKKSTTIAIAVIVFLITLFIVAHHFDLAQIHKMVHGS